MVDNAEELKKSAVKKVINILAEYGLKYRYLDFNNTDTDNNIMNQIIVTEDSVIIQLSWLYGNASGNNLKSIEKDLKQNDKKVSVSNEYIIFHFNIDELLNDSDTGSKGFAGSAGNNDTNQAQSETTTTVQDNETEKHSNKEIDTDDMIIIENIAKKYNMTLKNLVKTISKKDVKENDQVAIRFAAEELKTLDKKARKKNMSRSRFCRYACHRIINEYIRMDNIDFLSARGVYGEVKRDIKVCLLIPEEDRKQIKEFTEKLSLPLTTFIRYCILKI